MNERIAAIVVAAGQATRFGAPKILTPIAGVPAVIRVLNTVASIPEISSAVLVLHPDVQAEVESRIASAKLRLDLVTVPGGPRRQDSVKAGLDAAGNAEIAIIHDAARPLASVDLFQATIAAVRNGADAALAAVPVTDTIKRLTDTRVQTIDRSNLHRAQTPQAFRAAALRRGFAEAERLGIDVTDEATLIELTGGTVALVPGDEQNLKLTTQQDTRLLEALARADDGQPSVTRTGIGYDVHRLVHGRRLILGGVEIPFDRGLDGHSDADVLLHAIADAVLGACGLGDIGLHFPPGQDQFRDISSLTLLDRVVTLALERGSRITCVDATVIAEAPRLVPYREQMRASIATVLGLPETAVNLKATTNEGLGFAGRQEGIAALAVATVLGPI